LVDQNGAVAPFGVGDKATLESIGLKGRDFDDIEPPAQIFDGDGNREIRLGLKICVTSFSGEPASAKSIRETGINRPLFSPATAA